LSIPMDQDLLGGFRLGRLDGLVLGAFDELAVDEGRPGALDRDRRRMGSLQARKHFSDLDRPECGPGRGP
jgi:hypothetical protein